MILWVLAVYLCILLAVLSKGGLERDQAALFILRSPIPYSNANNTSIHNAPLSSL